MHETWEAFARDIHFARPEHIAYAILDSRRFDIKGFGRAIRSEVPPYQADTIEDLAALIGTPAGQLRETVDAFNRAATGDAARFDATRCDGLAASSELNPPKSNWARHRSTAISGLSTGRRPRLYIWRACDQREGGNRGRSRVSTRQEKSPGTFTAPRQTLFRCCGPLCSERSLDVRPSISLAGEPGTQHRRDKMASEQGGAFIRNIAEVPWREFPNHFGGALSKPAGSSTPRRSSISTSCANRSRSRRSASPSSAHECDEALC